MSALSLLARLGLTASATKARQPSQFFMLALSALMLVFAAQPLLLYLAPVVDLSEAMKDSPTLTTYRQPVRAE
jgi:hypothetical protein